jgi:hypothetical protein
MSPTNNIELPSDITIQCKNNDKEQSHHLLISFTSLSNCDQQQQQADKLKLYIEIRNVINDDNIKFDNAFITKIHRKSNDSSNTYFIQLEQISLPQNCNKARLRFRIHIDDNNKSPFTEWINFHITTNNNHFHWLLHNKPSLTVPTSIRYPKWMEKITKQIKNDDIQHGILILCPSVYTAGRCSKWQDIVSVLILSTIITVLYENTTKLQYFFGNKLSKMKGDTCIDRYMKPYYVHLFRPVTILQLWWITCVCYLDLTFNHKVMVGGGILVFPLVQVIGEEH